MLLNIHVENFINDTFAFDGPYIMSDRETLYEVAVRQFFMELSSANEIQNENELWILSSNLVDQTPINPRQALLYFTMNEYSKRHFVNLPSFTFYPLEKHQLDFPRFWIKRISPETSIQGNLTKAFLQLEIRKNVGNK